jgi:hypothetical protein
MMPWPGLLEPLTESICLGVVASLCVHHVLGVNPFLFLLFHLALWFLLDLALIRVVEVRRQSGMFQYKHVHRLNVWKSLCVISCFDEMVILAVNTIACWH